MSDTDKSGALTGATPLHPQRGSAVLRRLFVSILSHPARQDVKAAALKSHNNVGSMDRFGDRLRMARHRAELMAQKNRQPHLRSCSSFRDMPGAVFAAGNTTAATMRPHSTSLLPRFARRAAAQSRSLRARRDPQI